MKGFEMREQCISASLTTTSHHNEIDTFAESEKQDFPDCIIEYTVEKVEENTDIITEEIDKGGDEKATKSSIGKKRKFPQENILSPNRRRKETNLKYCTIQYLEKNLSNNMI